MSLECDILQKFGPPCHGSIAEWKQHAKICLKQDDTYLFIQFPVDHLGLKHIGDEETSALCQKDKKSPHS